MHIKFKTKFRFIQNSWFFILVSAVLVVASIVGMYTKGFNYGIEFRGGVKLIVKFSAPTSDGAIKEAMDKSGFDAIVQRLGTGKEERFTIKTKQTEASLEETMAKVRSALALQYGEGAYIIESEETVGPTVGKELRRKGILAVVLTLGGILIYLSLRFNFMYAPGAVIALFHDVLIICGFVILTNTEFNLSILAVLLTIAGYSVNDTIVIFDRIRENTGRLSQTTIVDVVNECINATLSRTIITSLTVFMVVVVLYFLGGGVVHDFAKAFIVGTIAGVYSTIFIASPVFIFMFRHWPKVAVKLHLRKEV